MPQSFGITLIEILISLLFLAVMLLGLDAMQLTALKQAKSAYFYSVANQQINNLTERLSLSNNKIIEKEIERWNEQNREVLPQGIGKMNGNIISIFWGEFEKQTCDYNQLGVQGCLLRKVSSKRQAD